MALEIRHANPSDYGRVIQHVNAWWGGRDMAPMLPKLFFLHFEGTSFVAEDEEGKLVAFLIGFLSRRIPRRRTSISSVFHRASEGRASVVSSTSASSPSSRRKGGRSFVASPRR